MSERDYAADARRAITAYVQDGSNDMDATVDLMADLLHFARSIGDDPERVLRVAWEHYMAESFAAS